MLDLLLLSLKRGNITHFANAILPVLIRCIDMCICITNPLDNMQYELCYMHTPPHAPTQSYFNNGFFLSTQLDIRRFDHRR